VLAQLVQFLKIQDLLNFRQVNLVCDYIVRWRMRHIGASVKVFKTDEAIEKFRTEMVEGFGILPFSVFSLDVTSISLDGIADTCVSDT